MSSQVSILLQKIRALRTRAQQIQDLVRSNRQVPRELQIDDKEMVALEEHIGKIAADELGVAEVDKAIWRRFWHAAYEDWDRSEGPTRFWETANRQLASTEEFLLSLSSASNMSSPNSSRSEPISGNSTASGPRSGQLIISVHGIRTRGAWQRKVTRILNEAGFRHDPLDYGFFSAIRLLWPPARRHQVDWFREIYTRSTEREKGFCSIIAHSLGTYLVTEAIRIYPDIKFDAVILCGSIVRTDYPWSELIEQGQVRRVLNQYGRRDIWAALAAWVIKNAGRSGAEGFEDEGQGKVLQRGYAEWRHSDFFHTLNYKHTWIPFLKGDPVPDLNTQSRSRPNWRFRIVMALALFLFSSLFLWLSLALYWTTTRYTLIDLADDGTTQVALLAERVDHRPLMDQQLRKFYLSNVHLLLKRGQTKQVSKVTELYLPEDSQGALDLDETNVMFFLNHKTTDSTYVMDGVYFIVDLNTLRAKYSVTVFNAENWGWYAWFHEKKAFHFSYDGYYLMAYDPVTGTNEEVRRIAPADAIAEHDKWLAKHSRGQLPLEKSRDIFRILGISLYLPRMLGGYA